MNPRLDSFAGGGAVASKAQWTDHELVCDDVFKMHPNLDHVFEIIEVYVDHLSPAELKYWVETYNLRPRSPLRARPYRPRKKKEAPHERKIDPGRDSPDNQVRG